MHYVKSGTNYIDQLGIKSRDTMANLVWANTYSSGYMHNSVGIIVCSS